MNPTGTWPPVASVVVYSAAWFAISLAAGWVGHRIPPERLLDDGRVTRLQRWERHGRAYERLLRIKWWKDRLPEAGGFFRGGVSKRSLRGRTEPALRLFAAETRRAERVHWVIALGALSFFAWSPPAVALCMVGFGLLWNLPFIAVQRYNRARIERIVRRLAARDGLGSDTSVVVTDHHRAS